MDELVRRPGRLERTVTKVVATLFAAFSGIGTILVYAHGLMTIIQGRFSLGDDWYFGYLVLPGVFVTAILLARYGNARDANRAVGQWIVWGRRARKKD